MCATLGLATCLEARSSGVTSGQILWSDGTGTTLSAPTVPFAVTSTGSRQTGSSLSLYSDFGLHGGIDPVLGVGAGPTRLIDYAVETRPDLALTVSTGYSSGLGQATSNFFNGGLSLDSNLKFTGNAQTELGINHSSSSIIGNVEAPFAIGATNTINPGATGSARPSAVATGQSYWVDTILPSSTSRTLTFGVNLEGSLTGNASVIYSLVAVDSHNVSHSIVSSVVLGDVQPGHVSDYLVGSLSIDPGLSYRLTGTLLANTSVPDFASSFAGGLISAGADFFDTAQVSSIVASDALDVDYASGPLSYLSSITNVAAVTEPETWALIVAGLGALGITKRRSLRVRDRSDAALFG